MKMYEPGFYVVTIEDRIFHVGVVCLTMPHPAEEGVGLAVPAPAIIFYGAKGDLSIEEIAEAQHAIMNWEGKWEMASLVKMEQPAQAWGTRKEAGDIVPQKVKSHGQKPSPETIRAVMRHALMSARKCKALGDQETDPVERQELKEDFDTFCHVLHTLCWVSGNWESAAIVSADNGEELMQSFVRSFVTTATQFNPIVN